MGKIEHLVYLQIAHQILKVPRVLAPRGALPRTSFKSSTVLKAVLSYKFSQKYG